MVGASSMPRREVYVEFRWGGLKERDYLKDLEVKLMIFFEKDQKEVGLLYVDWENVPRDKNKLDSYFEYHEPQGYTKRGKFL